MAAAKAKAQRGDIGPFALAPSIIPPLKRQCQLSGLRITSGAISVHQTPKRMGHASILVIDSALCQEFEGPEMTPVSRQQRHVEFAEDIVENSHVDLTEFVSISSVSPNPAFSPRRYPRLLQRSSPSRSAAIAGVAPSPLPSVSTAPSVGRTTSNSNGGRKRSRDEADSDDDEIDECLGTWVGKFTEFDLTLGLDGDSAPLAAFTVKDRMRTFIDSKHHNGRACIAEIIATNIWGVVVVLKWAAGCSHRMTQKRHTKCCKKT